MERRVAEIVARVDVGAASHEQPQHRRTYAIVDVPIAQKLRIRRWIRIHWSRISRRETEKEREVWVVTECLIVIAAREVVQRRVAVLCTHEAHRNRHQ